MHVLGTQEAQQGLAPNPSGEVPGSPYTSGPAAPDFAAWRNELMASPGTDNRELDVTPGQEATIREGVLDKLSIAESGAPVPITREEQEYVFRLATEQRAGIEQSEIPRRRDISRLRRLVRLSEWALANVPQPDDIDLQYIPQAVTSLPIHPDARQTVDDLNTITELRLYGNLPPVDPTILRHLSEKLSHHAATLRGNNLPDHEGLFSGQLIKLTQEEDIVLNALRATAAQRRGDTSDHAAQPELPGAESAQQTMQDDDSTAELQLSARGTLVSDSRGGLVRHIRRSRLARRSARTVPRHVSQGVDGAQRVMRHAA
jgi:hypothetical protein